MELKIYWKESENKQISTEKLTENYCNAENGRGQSGRKRLVVFVNLGP
jgi:hypothetical protein